MMPLLWLLMAAGTHEAAPAASMYAIQPPGIFHSGEAVARHGERWLALTVGDGRSQLARKRVRVKAVVDELLDGAGEATGQAVSVNGDEAVIAFLRGPLLRPGPMVAARVEQDDGRHLPAKTIRFEGKHYRLETRCEGAPAPNVAADVWPYRCHIELVDGARRQTLVVMDGSRMRAAVDADSDGQTGAATTMMLGDDASPELIFAGDLDRDGKLDLIFDTSDHYNVSQPTLFLSGAAEGDELLHAVATYEAVGC